jgi:F0F1-type ATP synthase membrane subunit c/vacuolar-type H+-ATPase subunit K
MIGIGIGIAIAIAIGHRIVSARAVSKSAPDSDFDMFLVAALPRLAYSVGAGTYSAKPLTC